MRPPRKNNPVSLPGLAGLYFHSSLCPVTSIVTCYLLFYSPITGRVRNGSGFLLLKKVLCYCHFKLQQENVPRLKRKCDCLFLLLFPKTQFPLIKLVI